MPNLTTKAPKSGVTLIEVMVAGGLFLLVVAATYMIYDLAQRSNRKTDLHSETYRQGAVALRHIRRELKGAIVNPDCAQHEELDDLAEKKVCFLVPQWKDGHIVVDHRGVPETLPEAIIYVKDGKLVREDSAGVRTLAEIGADGDASFLYADQLLTVTVRIEKDGEIANDRNHSERELTMTVGLANKTFWRDLTVLTKS